MNRGTKPEILESPKLYEATGDKFFLEKMRNIWMHILNGNISELNIKNDFSTEEILRLKFAFGPEKLTRAEAEEMSNFLLGDEGS